jgi:hypothetical protein
MGGGLQQGSRDEGESRKDERIVGKKGFSVQCHDPTILKDLGDSCGNHLSRRQPQRRTRDTPQANQGRDISDRGWGVFPTGCVVNERRGRRQLGA